MSTLPTTLYKYVDAKGATAILSKHLLRWTAPLKLDDPMEVDGNRFAVPSNTAIRHRLDTQFRELVFGEREPAFAVDGGVSQMVRQFRARRTSGRDITAGVELFLNTAFSLDHHNTVEETISQAMNTRRLCCMTEIRDSPSMWSSFGCKFTGAVIGFRPLLTLFMGVSTPERVKYSENPIDLHAVTEDEWIAYLLDLAGIDARGAFERAVLTKSAEYRHQLEWRHTIRVEDGVPDVVDLPVPLDHIQQVILGERMVTADVTAILAVLRSASPQVEVYRTKSTAASPAAVPLEPLQ